MKKYIHILCYVHGHYYSNSLEEEKYKIISKDTKNAFCKIYHALFIKIPYNVGLECCKYESESIRN